PGERNLPRAGCRSGARDSRSCVSSASHPRTTDPQESLMTVTNRRFVLASRPTGAPREDNFRLESAAVPELAPGQVLVRHHYLSLDLYLRGRMNGHKTYYATH